jgi:hypothetical protein
MPCQRAQFNLSWHFQNHCFSFLFCLPNTTLSSGHNPLLQPSPSTIEKLHVAVGTSGTKMHTSISISSLSSTSSIQHGFERSRDQCQGGCRFCFAFFLFLVISLFLVIASWTSYFFGRCILCPPGTVYMKEPFRVVPGSSTTCQEVGTSPRICRAHRSLMKKFDLASYCGCDKSDPPPNECTINCPLSWSLEQSTSTPTISSGLTPPTMSPIELSRSHGYPSHFDELLLLDPTLAPSDQSSSSDGDEPSNRLLAPRGNNTGTSMCSDTSTLLPFISDPGFCKEVQDSCCSEITSLAKDEQAGIPLACMMCEPGVQVLEEKILVGDANGKQKVHSSLV